MVDVYNASTFKLDNSGGILELSQFSFDSENYLEKLKSWLFSNNHVLNSSDLVVACGSFNQSLVPYALSTEKNSWLFNSDKLSKITQKLDDLELENQLWIDNDVYQYLNHNLNYSKLIPLGSGLLIDGVLKSKSHSDTNTITINLEEHYLNLMVFNFKEVLFSNIFSVLSIEDAMYYLLYTAQILKLDLKLIHLYYSGNHSNLELFIEQIASYIKHIEPASENPTQHLYSSLSLCE